MVAFLPSVSMVEWNSFVCKFVLLLNTSTIRFALPRDWPRSSTPPSTEITSMRYSCRHNIPHVSSSASDHSLAARLGPQAHSNQHLWEGRKRQADHGHGGARQDALPIFLQGAQVQSNGHLWEGTKRQVDYGRRDAEHDTSPISPLSPPNSSTSSEFLGYVGCSDNQYESDLCRNEVSSCSHNDISEIHASQTHAFLQFGADSAFAPTIDRSDFSGKPMMHRLHELESVLLAPDVSDANMSDLGSKNAGTWGECIEGFLDAGSPPKSLTISVDRDRRDGASDCLYTSRQPLRPSSKGSHLKRLLVCCAEAISEERMEAAEQSMQELKKRVSVYGDPLERLAAYLYEGLVARLHASGSVIYNELKCNETLADEVLSAMRKLFEICPYIKFAYMAANGAIAEAFKNESLVHIFDFQIDQGIQWISLIQALASRPGGAPCIRISTIDDPTAQSYSQGNLHFVRWWLTKLANSLNVAFEFTPISIKPCDLEASMIERRPGEALAMNFALKLHHMPDESVCLHNPRDHLLRLAKSLNPKVLTLVEQDLNTNTAPFYARFVETLDYYSAVFESIDVALSRESRDRVKVEELCLAQEIVNVIACEGLQRVERYELAGKWRSRMLMAGFKPHPLSMYVNNILKSLLESYNEFYKLREDGLILLLGWKDRSLVAASAWH